MTTPELHYLRLFPLGGAVLFPGMELPLVVFEPRYRQLVQECEDEDAPFGVLLLQSGREVADPGAEPYRVGTTAHIREAEAGADGRLHVVSVGRRRFRVHSLSYEQPYLAAQVEYMTDEEYGAAAGELAVRVRVATVDYVKALASLRGGWLQEVPLPEDPGELTYLVAQLFQGKRQTQQRLLESATTAARLEDEEVLLASAQQRVDQLIQKKRSERESNLN